MPPQSPFAAGTAWRRLGVYRERAAALHGRLEDALGLRLPATVFFDHPTPSALVAYVLGEESPGVLPVEPERDTDLTAP